MTAIEWTHRPGTRGESWNPVKARNKATGQIGWHCTHASEGCRNCYAEKRNRGFFRLGTRLDYKPGNEKLIDIYLDEAALAQPLRWKAPRTIFVCSMTDLFGEFVSDHMIDRIFAVAALCPQHTFIVLTKRARRMREYLNDEETPGRVAMAAYDLWAQHRAPGDKGNLFFMLRHDDDPDIDLHDWPLPNVWLGVSAEDQKTADERVPELLETPAAIRFVSAEPLLSPIDFTSICTGHYFIDALRGVKFHDASESESSAIEDCAWLDQIIVGGESGPKARPMHPAWPRSILRQCTAEGTAFFFKQWGSNAVVYDRQRDDPDWRRCAIVARQTSRGRWLNLAGGHGFHGEQVVRVNPVGKKKAGRLLDGVEHNGWPEVRS